MIDYILRDLQVLWKADLLIGKIWLNALIRRCGLVAFAGLIAVFGLGMANLAGYYALQALIGPVGAAILVASVDFAITIILLIIASKSQPGREIDVAFEVRQIAVESVQADTRDLKLTLDALGHEMKAMKETITALAHNPLDLAAQKLLIPASLSIVRGLRAKRENAS